MILSYDDIRNLPLPDLSLRLLRSLDDQANFNNFIRGFEQRGGYDQPKPHDLSTMLTRLSDAWAWLVAHALIGPSATNPNGGWFRLTAAGAEVMEDPNSLAKVWAADRLAGDLHPALSAARSNFALGDYETASFAAMKAVEVEVRRVAGLPNELLGVALMRKAFSPKDGALRDTGAEAGEQQATADLFAGAIGAYKNPASHRTVQFDDPVEAAEVLQFGRPAAAYHPAGGRTPAPIDADYTLPLLHVMRCRLPQLPQWTQACGCGPIVDPPLVCTLPAQKGGMSGARVRMGLCLPRTSH